MPKQKINGSLGGFMISWASQTVWIFLFLLEGEDIMKGWTFFSNMFPQFL